MANRLLGCPAEFINRIVKRFDIIYRFHDSDYYKQYLDNEINQLSTNIINTYCIKDCQNVIISHGDFIDALIKTRDIDININNKLMAFRQLALPYVKKWISNKIHQKIFILNAKRRNEEHTCSICLEQIPHNASLITVTKCGHVFHNDCIKRWNKTSCPMCRSDM